MSDKININFTGRVGQIPKMHYATKEFVTFPVAVNHAEKNELGVFTQITNWFNCISYNQFLIKDIVTKLKQGSKVYICGELRVKEIVGENGTKTHLNINLINFKSFDQYAPAEQKEKLVYEDLEDEPEPQPLPTKIKIDKTVDIQDDEIPF